MRTSAGPLPSTALKPSSERFVFWDLHRVTVSRLYSTLHTHSWPHKLWSTVAAQEHEAERTAVSEGATMQHPVYGLPRIPLPRTPVHRARTRARAATPRSSRC